MLLHMKGDNGQTVLNGRWIGSSSQWRKIDMMNERRTKMYNDACKCEGNAVPAPTEPMKAIFSDLNDIMNKSREVAGIIEVQLFGSNISVNCTESKASSMYEALISMRMIAKETAEILYSINQRING